MARAKKSGIWALILVVCVGLFLGKIYWFDKLPQNAKKATSIGQVALPDAPEASLSGNATMLALPAGGPAANDGIQIDWKVMAWNAQFPLMYANGAGGEGPEKGVLTQKGSLFDKANIRVNIIRQDDCNKSCADLTKFAKDYKANPQSRGVFVTFMGDGCPAFFAALCKELEPMGPDYQPITFYPMGKSYGEDGVWGPAIWLTNPKMALGKMVACVLRDGDMNILLKWAGDNGLAVNPDETTYDPNAINLISANDFLDAPNKYITGYQEKRKLIVNGKKVSQDTTVGVDAVATWTPGDVNIAEKKGGLVVIANTKQYATQMPAVTLTIKKYAYDHRTDFENLIMALASAGDQVRSFDKAKQFAADVSAKVYVEQTGAYWYKYYNGVMQKNYTGDMVHLGGSMAFNLADAAAMFGMGKDGIDRYKMVYTTFGDILSKMYPEILATYPPYQKVVDKSFLMSVVSNHPELMEGKALAVQYADNITQQVSSKSYQIQFASGSAEIEPVSYKVLDQIMASAVVAEGLKVGVYGHTDNIGSPASNVTLSDARAASVRSYLVTKGLVVARIESKGFGDTQPVADNATPAGRAQNRRVQIVLGQ